MSYTFTTALGDGTTTVFPFSFAGQDTGYLSTSNVQVFVGGVSVPFTINLTDPNKVQLSTPPAVGAEVLIRRIMPKNVPYSDFARGNPFSQDTLNNTNLQQLYVVQELLDGFLPVGFYLKQDVNMGGHILVNLGQGTKSGDSVNWDQYDELEHRVESLETDLTGVSSRTIPYYYIATGGEVRWDVPAWQFTTALMFINGVFQNQNLGAFSISSNGFNFAEPLQKGDEVYVLLGSTVSPITDIMASKVYADTVILSTGLLITSGVGSPVGILSAPVGSLYLRKDGGTLTTLYIKETGSGNMGWVAK